MGRDDARPIAGLQGGTAPARAFSDFMRVAVARRPVENFQIEVPLPDWQLEPDEEVWGNLTDDVPLVDADGNPIGDPSRPADPLAPGAQPPEGSQVDQQWMDEVLDRRARRGSQHRSRSSRSDRRRRRRVQSLRPTRFSRGPTVAAI